MQTIQYRKSRIWEMKEDKYKERLTKNQVCAIFHIKKKHFTQIYKALNGVAMLVSLWRGTNIAAENQQKHLFLSFPNNAWIHYLRNSETRDVRW